MMIFGLDEHIKTEFTTNVDDPVYMMACFPVGYHSGYHYMSHKICASYPFLCDRSCIEMVVLSAKNLIFNMIFNNFL